MKKWIPIFLIFFLLTFSGCGRQQEAPAVPIETPTTEAATFPTEAPTEATHPQIISHGEGIFVEQAEVTDGAYDRVGVVLYTSLDGQTTYVAFLDTDGNYVHCGVQAPLYWQPELTYLGDGVVTFRLQTEDQTPYLCKITYSLTEDGKGTNFKVETDLP